MRSGKPERTWTVSYTHLAGDSQMTPPPPPPRHQPSVIELSGLDFIDSAGLGMLLIVRDAAAAHSAKVVLRGAREQAKRLIQVARFDSLFTVE